jgi:hypothetical protein
LPRITIEAESRPPALEEWVERFAEAFVEEQRRVRMKYILDTTVSAALRFTFAGEPLAELSQALPDDVDPTPPGVGED